MADVRPLRALRYTPQLDLGALLCPPFDVVSPQQVEALRRQSPYNAIHLEVPGHGDEAYQEAAATLQRWQSQKIVAVDPDPAFYMLEQQFTHQGAILQRRALMARVRLLPWEEGIILPHEHTLKAPKEDRLRLLRALRVQVSPVFGLYQETQDTTTSIAGDEGWEELATFQDAERNRYRLLRTTSQDRVEAITKAFAPLRIYIADGHHRYETGLAYRDERRTPIWTGEEPENFVLMGLVAAQAPGLLLLPLHQLVKSPVPLEMALDRLMPFLDIETVPTLEALLALLAQRGKGVTTIGLASSSSPDFYLMSALDLEAVSRLLPPDSPPQWRTVDAAVARYVVIAHGLGVQVARDSKELSYTPDAHEALHRVKSGEFSYALFVNPAPLSQVISLADAGVRMPPKSTYFYPKIPAGALFYPFHL